MRTEEAAPTAERAVQRRRRRLAREWLLVAATLSTFAAFVGAGAWTWRLDQALYDAGLALLERPDAGRTVIVAIDEESLAAHGRWPWPRRVHAELLERIAAAHPKAVGIDVAFIEPETPDPEGDRRLAEALSRSPGVVLPVVLDGPRERPPLAALAAHARLAHVAASLDADGVLRGFAPVRGDGAGAREHFSVAMARAGGATPAIDAPRIDIAFAGPPGHFPRIPAAAVLRGEAAGALAGRYVLVGATATGLGDRFATPSTVRGGPMPGVEVMANALDGLLAGQRVHRLPQWTAALAAIVATLALMLVFVVSTPRVSLGAALATALGAPIAAFALLGATRSWIPPMTLFTAALLAYPAWSWRRLEAASRYLDEELDRLRTESPVTADRRATAARKGDFLGRRIDAVSDAVGMLRNARRLVVDSLEGLPHGALVADLEGRVAIANRLADALGPDAAEGRLLADVLAPLSPAGGAPWSSLLDMARGAPATALEAASKDGRVYMVRLGPFRDGEGRDAGLIAVVEDITELRQAQREREETLAFVSHDLRSPQSSIIAMAELQRIESTRQPEEAFIAKVEQLAWKTVALAEDFVHLTRADTRPLSLAVLDFALLAEGCAEEIGAQADAKRIAIACARSGDARVRADRALAGRAITNLLSNAIKYSGEGTRIDIAVARVGGEVGCTITDRGVGLSAADRERLFRHFERIESVSRATRAKGIGLGLVFVETVARRHGGRVTVESEPGKGSSFSLWLPAPAAEELQREDQQQ